MILLIDIGNSNICFGLHDSKTLINTYRIKSMADKSKNIKSVGASRRGGLDLLMSSLADGSGLGQIGAKKRYSLAPTNPLISNNNDLQNAFNKLGKK